MRGGVTRFAGRWRRRAAVLVVLVLVPILLVGGLRRHASPLSPLRPAALTIVPGLHLLGGLSPSAAYAVETPEGLVLVDSGLDPDAGRLKAQLAELGLEWRALRAILLTHAHGDHSGGAAHLRAATGAKVYAGLGDAPVLRAGGPREAFFSTFDMPGHSPRPTPVDVALEGDETIVIGDVRIRALATPGHTPGSICYLMERAGQRVLFAGDLLMRLRGEPEPRGELGKPLGTYAAYLAPRYRGDAGAFLASLRRLRALPVPDLVLPGHPADDPTPQSPRLSQARWESLLDEGIRDMERLLARYEVDGAGFLDGDPKVLLPGLYYLGDFRGAAVYGLFASAKFFVVDAPGGPGLVEFLRDRLRRLGLGPMAPTAVLLTSCGPEATAGLRELVEEYHPRVVAAPEGLAGLERSCPAGTTLLSAEELPQQGWFPVTPIPLRGRGKGAVAYRLSWAGKAVLFSGRIPIKANQEAGVPLIRDFLEGRGNARDYFASLNRLYESWPDLWLPLFPSKGQNAHLYDDQWGRTIDENRAVIEMNSQLLRRFNKLP